MAREPSCQSEGVVDRDRIPSNREFLDWPAVRKLAETTKVGAKDGHEFSKRAFSKRLIGKSRVDYIYIDFERINATPIKGTGELIDVTLKKCLQRHASVYGTVTLLIDLSLTRERELHQFSNRRECPRGGGF